MIRPYKGNLIRNLLYHVYPKKGNGVWQWNVSQLLRRMDQFNGQRLVSVVTDDTTDTLDDVRAAFRGTVKDFSHAQNDKTLGEVSSFGDLLKRVENIDPRQVTFYAHAKGVKYPPGTKHMVHRWAEVMYGNMLDYPTLVEDSLRSHPLVGTFLKSGNAFGSLPPSWHYAGTFFWLRNLAVFEQPNWSHIPQQWWGTEAWPGVVCPRESADCLLMEGTAPKMQLYARGYWEQEVDPVWHQWQVQHSGLRSQCSYGEVLRGLRSSKVVVTGPQRSGTMIAAKILAHDLKLPFVDELEFGVHDFNVFMKSLSNRSAFVVQAPTMSAYAHLLPYTVVWMRRDLQDVLRSQRRIGWEQHEQLERDRYFDHTKRASAVVKTEAWEKFQRIALGERAFDLNYQSLASHPMWVDQESRKGFTARQTCYPSK